MRLVLVVFMVCHENLLDFIAIPEIFFFICFSRLIIGQKKNTFNFGVTSEHGKTAHTYIHEYYICSFSSFPHCDLIKNIC